MEFVWKKKFKRKIERIGRGERTMKSELIRDLELLKWNLHNNSWYDLEDELRVMNNLDKAIKIIFKLKELNKELEEEAEKQ